MHICTIFRSQQSPQSPGSKMVRVKEFVLCSEDARLVQEETQSLLSASHASENSGSSCFGGLRPASPLGCQRHLLGSAPAALLDTLLRPTVVPLTLRSRLVLLGWLRVAVGVEGQAAQRSGKQGNWPRHMNSWEAQFDCVVVRIEAHAGHQLHTVRCQQNWQGCEGGKILHSRLRQPALWRHSFERIGASWCDLILCAAIFPTDCVPHELWMDEVATCQFLDILLQWHACGRHVSQHWRGFSCRVLREHRAVRRQLG